MRRIATHVLVAVLVAAFVALGLWQLARRSESSRATAERAAALAAPPVGPTDLADADLAYRHFEGVGVYDVGNELLLRNRTRGFTNGNHVLTPLIFDDADDNSPGLALIVDRGWVPLEMEDVPVADAAPPDGPVAVSGLLMPAERPRGIGPRDPASGPLTKVFRVDTDRIAVHAGYPVANVYLVLYEQDPAQGGDLPDAGDLHSVQVGGPPHLSYAIQWFSFAIITSVGYVVLLRRRAASTTSA